MATAKKPLAGKQLVDQIVKIAQDKIAEKIVVIDLRGVPGAADWFIICQSDNTTHTTAIAAEISSSLKELGTRPWREEGVDQGRWVLLDYSDVVVHVMLPELREYYSLETLWPDCPKTEAPELHKSGEEQSRR